MVIDYERDQRNRVTVIKREAREEGEAIGIKQGEKNKELEVVQTLVNGTDFDDRTIASFVSVEESFVRKIRARR